jgi:hypothetical protein
LASGHRPFRREGAVPAKHDSPSRELAMARTVLGLEVGKAPEKEGGFMTSQSTLTAVLAGTLMAVVAAAPIDAQAQAPTPRALVSGLDLECYQTPGPALNIAVNLAHLNPVLINLGLPPHAVFIKELAQTCTPVSKNGVMPAATALPFVQHIDFACYKVEAPPLANPVPINLTHLNPVLANLQSHIVTLKQPAQLCVPVAKNNMLPPAAVLALVQFVDLECYDTDPQPHPQFMVGLTQLNPQLAGIAPHPMTLEGSRRQLCVPVRKNAQAIPQAILDLIRWIDLEKFPAVANVMIAPVAVQLRHLNPLFVNLQPVPVVLQTASSLMVPVAKNGVFPPID